MTTAELLRLLKRMAAPWCGMEAIMISISAPLRAISSLLSAMPKKKFQTVHCKTSSNVPD